MIQLVYHDVMFNVIIYTFNVEMRLIIILNQFVKLLGVISLHNMKTWIFARNKGSIYLVLFTFILYVYIPFHLLIYLNEMYTKTGNGGIVRRKNLNCQRHKKLKPLTTTKRRIKTLLRLLLLLQPLQNLPSEPLLQPWPPRLPQTSQPHQPQPWTTLSFLPPVQPPRSQSWKLARSLPCPGGKESLEKVQLSSSSRNHLHLNPPPQPPLLLLQRKKSQHILPQHFEALPEVQPLL